MKEKKKLEDEENKKKEERDRSQRVVAMEKMRKDKNDIASIEKVLKEKMKENNQTAHTLLHEANERTVLL